MASFFIASPIRTKLSGFLVPSACSFKDFIGWTGVGVGIFVVCKIGNQVSFGGAVFVACILFGMRHYGGDVFVPALMEFVSVVVVLVH